MPRPRVPASPFRYFNSSPEVIRLAVMMYVKYPLSLRNVEDLLHERGIAQLFTGDMRTVRVSITLAASAICRTLVEGVKWAVELMGCAPVQKQHQNALRRSHGLVCAVPWLTKQVHQRHDREPDRKPQ